MKRFIVVILLTSLLLLSSCIVEPNNSMDNLNVALRDIASNNYLITYDFMDNYPDSDFAYCYVDGNDYLTYTNISSNANGYINVYYYFEEEGKRYMYICYKSKEFFFDCTNISEEDEKYIPCFKFFFASGVDVDTAIKEGEWKYNLEDDNYSFVDYIYDLSLDEDNIIKMVMTPEVKNNKTYRATLICYFYQYELAVPVGLVYTQFGTTSIPESYKLKLDLSDAEEADFESLIKYINGSEDEAEE